jgi:hypothetical protein
MPILADTLLPLIFKSDRTHLSNFAGGKTEWRVYMTIANISSKIRQMPSMHTVVIVALLTIPIRNRNILQKRLDKQRQTNREVLNEELRQLLHPLTIKQSPNAKSGYYNVLCADGNFRRCKLVLAAWCADCSEYSDLHHLERHVCVWCKCPKNAHAHYVPSDKQHPWRDHNLYRMLSDPKTKAADAELSSRHVYRGFNVFQQIICIVNDLPKPDLLHTM